MIEADCSTLQLFGIRISAGFNFVSARSDANLNKDEQMWREEGTRTGVLVDQESDNCERRGLLDCLLQPATYSREYSELAKRSSWKYQIRA